MVCLVSEEIGIGHFSRLLALSNKLRNDTHIEFLIYGKLPHLINKTNFKYTLKNIDANFSKSLEDFINENNFTCAVLDIHHSVVSNDLYRSFKNINKKATRLIGIDSLIEFHHYFEFLWIPSIIFNKDSLPKGCKNISWGWDHLLIEKKYKDFEWRDGDDILVLTGGSDTALLGEWLPEEIDSKIEKGSKVRWVKGPFAKQPKIPNKSKLKWIVEDSPANLDNLITKSNYVIVVFGISFFETIQYGVPTVVFSPYNNKDEYVLNQIQKEGVALVAKNAKDAVKNLNTLMLKKATAKNLSIKSKSRFDDYNSGQNNLKRKIMDVLKN